MYAQPRPRWRFLSGVRARLVLLALAAVVPIAAYIVYHGAEHRAAEIEEAKAQLGAKARLAAAELDEVIGGTMQLLDGLSHAPEIADAARCPAFLAGVHARYPKYASLVFVTPAGDATCISLPGAKPTNIGDREYFQRALASGKPEAGAPVLGRASGAFVLPVIHPVRAASGEVRGYLFAGLDLAKHVGSFHRVQLHPLERIVLWNREGLPIARYPDPERLAGKPAPAADIARIVTAPAHGVSAQAMGLDGRERLRGIARLPETRGTGIRVTVSVPVQVLVAQADRAFEGLLAASGLVLLAALAFAWAIAEGMIRRPLARLAAAGEQLGEGNFAIRLGAPYPKGEIGELMTAFDRTAAALESQSAERAKAEEALHALNAELERRVAERTEELARANADLARASEMKSQFLATMSHELRTPLNAILGFSEVLRDGLAGELTAEQKTFAADIHSSGRHLLDLINDILDLSKVEAGMMTLEPEVVRAAEIVHGGLTMVKERAQKHRVHLATEVQPGLPEFAADPRKVKQIVYNLLANAVRFTPEGGTVTLAARRVARGSIALPAGAGTRLGPPPVSDATEFAEFAVRDTGIGVAPADLERLFRPFVQVDSSLARQQQGTGLGLAMVKNLAELHGGTFGVASEPGKGSSFLVWLPLVAPAEERAAPAVVAPAIALPAVEAHAGPPLALVIEDDDEAARLIESALWSEGFRTMRAATGEEGLVRAAKERPQLVTLDVYLPNMDGWLVIERMKADPALADIPVVIISITSELDHGMALGATRVLQKPFSRAELRSALAGVVAFEGDGTPCSVLIVDDNPQAVELLAAHLGESPCRLLRAYGGREAIESAARARPDLILLDLMMPEVSGFDVVQTLKARPETAPIPIVVVTAKDLTAEDRATLNGHVERVLQKSRFDRAEFLTEVRRAMHKGGGQVFSLQPAPQVRIAN